jgi:putative peptide zinc metalloprotease protein
MDNAVIVAGTSRVRLRRLSERRDGEGWVIGRIETGDFISVPAVAHRVITLLSQGNTVDAASARLHAETGIAFAVADFVVALDELGFVAAIDDCVRTDIARPRPSLPWLQPGHVRWLLHPLTPLPVVGFAAATVVILVSHPALAPSYRVLVWSRHAGLVLAINAAIAWTIILVHESAHLAAARAAGAPARITISTRLQFLAAQTDVSGVWAAPRRVRMTVYLAGMGIDVCGTGACLLILALADPHGIVRNLLAVIAAQALLALPLQFMVFMRTDVYFVLQDLTGCPNLYADGAAHLRYVAAKLTRLVRHGVGPEHDPSSAYPPEQRRAVRAYTVVLLAGTAACLGVEFAVSLPALITFIVRAVSEVGTTPAATVDGAAALAILLAWQSLWATRWWQRHRHQVQSLTRQSLLKIRDDRGHRRQVLDASQARQGGTCGRNSAAQPSANSAHCKRRASATSKELSPVTTGEQAREMGEEVTLHGESTTGAGGRGDHT